jgi:hypothetical protein
VSADERASWEALVEFFDVLGVVTERRDGAVLIAWPPGPVDEPRRPILLERTEHFGEPWLEATAPLCEASRIAPRQALELNAVLSVGQVATVGDTCVVRHSAPLGALRWRDLDQMLALLAWTPAAILDHGPIERDDVFAHWG